MSDQDIKILENVLEMIRECFKTLKRQAGFGESCGKREGLGIRRRPGCRKQNSRSTSEHHHRQGTNGLSK